MHYIRFLKLPKLAASKNNTHECCSKITIQNDLGELFLTSALPLEVILLVNQRQQYLYQLEWQPYARTLDINFTIPNKYLQDTNGRLLPCELIVQRRSRCSNGTKHSTKNSTQSDRNTTQDKGRIISIYSEVFGLDHGNTTTVKRILPLNHGTTIIIREEKGESIARHIWDAGLILSEFFDLLIHNKSEIAIKLPCVSAALSRKDLKAIELGTGVGLVGIALAEILTNGDYGSPKILLTDLNDARELVEINTADNLKRNNQALTTFEELDWTKPLPERVANDDWDLILVSDCTYNPEYLKALVDTIKNLLLSEGQQKQLLEKREPLALLAMKPRHAAENVFFEYLEEASIRILEEMRIPLQVLGGEPQEIRILVFGL